MNKTGKKEPVWGPFLHLLRVTKLPYVWILVYTLFGLFQSQLNLMFPDYSQKITAGDVSTPTLAVMFAVVIGSSLLEGAINAVSGVTIAKISLRFRESVWGRVLRLPVSYYDSHMPRELINRVTEDTTLLSDNLARIPNSIVSCVYSLAGTFFMLFSYHKTLVVAELVIIPLLVGCTVLSGRLQFLRSDKIQARAAQLTGFIAEVLLHIPLVKSFVREDYEDKRGSGWIEELFKTRFKWTMFGSLGVTLSNSLSLVNTLLCVAAGAYLTARGEITLDIWLAFYLYSQGLMRTLGRLGGVWSSLKGIQGAARRIAEIAGEPFEKYEGSAGVPQSGLQVKDVTFRYQDRDVLDHISMDIPRGKITALVGPSGSGKSTLLRLLERFYQPTGGEIAAAGEDIGRFDLTAWRKSIGYVAQDTLLFSGTIRENILYGQGREVSEAELQAAADAACVTEFVQNLEHGYDTQVGEGGGKLSGGQRQRLGIARAILRNPSLLLLDEVTANLDAQAEDQVNRAIQNISKGRTVVSVAHRLDNIRSADQIVVLEDGQVRGAGVHEDLMENCPLYRRMVEAQRQDRFEKAEV